MGRRGSSVVSSSPPASPHRPAAPLRCISKARDHRIRTRLEVWRALFAVADARLDNGGQPERLGVATFAEFSICQCNDENQIVRLQAVGFSKRADGVVRTPVLA